MADAEEKKIARLDFGIDKAISSLDKIDQKLKTVSETSEKYAKNIGLALNSGVNYKEIAKSVGLSENQLRQLSKTAQKEAIITSEKRIREENKTTEAIKREHAKQAKSVETLSDKISNYAKTYLIYQGFNMLKRGVSDVIDEMVELENKMVQIDRVLNESGLNIDGYRDKLINLAFEYGNSMDNVADITLRLAQAGYNSDEALELTKNTLLALNTAELDATQATDDMVAVMAQWGLNTGTATEKADAYASIIDKINKVADNYPTTSADLMDALKKTSSAFNLAGASIDETIALITAAEVASQRGGKAIGTALGNITQQLKDEKRLTIAESLGLDFYTDSTKKQFKDITDIFAEMSTKMQELKDAGKENSVEMQNLLSIFTVFRRNVGASLLGEMSGEDNTYLQVLNDSLTSAGYSLQENTKYMKTAKAAQAQFNAELLKLKTEVWDSGLEDVFRDMLKMGIDLVTGITDLIDKFGLFPTSIGIVTLAFSTLNKNFQAFKYNTKTNKLELSGFLKSIADGTTSVRKTTLAIKEMKDGQMAMTVVNQKGIKAWVKNTTSVVNYGVKAAWTTVRTYALQAATIALNTAITMGLSYGITALVSAIDNWVHADEKAIEKNNELKQQAEDAANEINQEVSSIQELTKEYKEFSKTMNNSKDKNKLIDTENVNKAYELQGKINNAIKDSGKQVKLVTETTNQYGEKVEQVNAKYQEQLNLLRTIAFEEKQREAQKLKEAMELAKKNAENTKVSLDEIGKVFQFENLGSDFKLKFGNVVTETTGKQLSSSIFENSYYKLFDSASATEQMNILIQTKQLLEESGQTGSKAYEIIEESLRILKDEQKKVQEATDTYKNSLSELYALSGQVDVFDTFLSSIEDSYKKMGDGPKKIINDMQKINDKFREGEMTTEEYFNALQDQIKNINLKDAGDDLEAYQAIIAGVSETTAESIEQLINGLETGTINFTDYSDGIKEAAENTLDLYTKTNELEFKDGVWKDAAGNVNEYANSLQYAIGEMEGMGDLLKTLGDNYDYIAEHANEAGQAMFDVQDVGTKAYTNLANSVANSLNQMKNSNAQAYQTIVNDIYNAMGTTANEVTNADKYITEALNGNAQALNTALNASANQVALSTSKVTTSMGNVLSALGEAISNFSYSIKAQPYISGGIGLRKDANGVPTGLDLPAFGFDITGEGGTSVKNLGASLSSFGNDLKEYSSNKFTFNKLKSNVKPYTSTGGNTGSSGGSGSRGSGSSGSKKSGGSSSSSKDSDAKRKEEEKYKKRLDKFKESLDKMRDEEEDWVKKQKQLGLLSNKDMLYVTKQRISRYKKYLDTIKKATWMNKEDRKELMKEYTEEIKELELEYFEYLKEKLDEEIEAIEDARDKKIEALEDEYDKKIKKVEDAADAEIKALQKVEDERDRLREKEDYESERQGILDEIAYWEQRTGREAVESLADAKKRLEELDQEWARTQEDWDTEDAIKKIEEETEAKVKGLEEERDKKIKIAEETAKKEIELLQKGYNQKVKIFSESDKIIYDNSKISAKKLYNAYKDEFVDPLKKELSKINKSSNSTSSTKKTSSSSSSSSSSDYITYTIKSGDTLSAIAKKYNTTIKKIMAANSYITDANKIYAGKKLKIPKFHEGGIVGGNQEAFALLKPNEVILKTEWASSLNRMMKYFDNVTTGKVNTPLTGTNIKVNGDLVKIEANIKDKNDAEYLTRKIEKMLKDKFNIKK